MIEKIRAGKNYVPELSLIAELNNKIVGHILFSKIKISGHSIYNSLALAPVAVLPEYQKRGLGTKLVLKGLEMAKQLGFCSVIVLGHKDFYSKFGFQRASSWNIKCPFQVPDEAFMAIELSEKALNGKPGVVQYTAEFYEVD